MAIGTALVRARLQWEAACERVRFSLEPPDGAPAVTAGDLTAALRLAHEALDALALAFDLGPASGDSDSASTGRGARQLDGAGDGALDA